MGKVKVKNLSTFVIGINLPNVRFRRDLMPKQETALPEDVFEEFNYDPGCQAFIKDGFLQVITEDAELKAQISVKPTAKTSADVNVKYLLTEAPVKDLITVLKSKDLSPALKDEFIETARELKITDLGRSNALKQYLGFDCLEAVRMSIK